MRTAKLLLLLAFLLPTTAALAQTGKIAGRVVDLGSGDPLPGVNVAIEGTTQGAITDVDGYYNILNVRPGTYDLRASFIGYTPQVQEGVRVNIDLTAEVNFQLQEETVGLDEVVVSAVRPVVQRDVSASVANLSAEEIENLPVTDVAQVVGLQAGFERGLTIRGAGGDQVAFLVDGLSLSSGRNNTPFTGISYTAVDEVQVQTGGFNAEYGNVRAGLVNVVTKEGSRTRYSADVIVRYSPPSQKNFSGYDLEGNEVKLPSSPNAYWMRPFFDDEVAMTGTKSGAWDEYKIRQYPEFEGWNGKANAFRFNTDNDPTNDATPAQMEEAFKWYTRKNFEIESPDYEIDGTIGGPVPGISKFLGDLRFTTSYRQTQTMYIVPLVRDSYDERTWQGKLTSDVAPGMKLVLQGLWAKQMGINTNEQGHPDMYTGTMPYYPWDNIQPYLVNDLGRDYLFATHVRNPMDVTNTLVGAQFTHTLSSNTFYEVQLQRLTTDYNTFVTRERDYTVQKEVGPIKMNEEPFGWEWRDDYDILGTGMRTGGHWFSARDTSSVMRWNGSFDLTSQINRFWQVKSGLDFIYSDYNTRYGELDPAHPHHANPQYQWDRAPQQGALYTQSKLEFQGMVANVGLRLDYFHAGGDWYVFDRYDRALVFLPNDAMLQYRVATLLDLQLRPVEALIRYQRFLQQLELQRIEAIGNANAKLADAIARAQQRIIVLERQAR